MENKLTVRKTSLSNYSNEILLKKYSPKNCFKYVGKIKTITDAMDSKAPSIGCIHREKSRKFTEGLIAGWLIYLNQILSLNNPMSEDQIELCSTMIVEEFYGLNFSDLTFLFKRILAGYYGKFYERLSIPQVLTFFREYFEERCNLAEQISQKEHKALKDDKTFDISKNIKRIWQGTPSK